MSCICHSVLLVVNLLSFIQFNSWKLLALVWDVLNQTLNVVLLFLQCGINSGLHIIIFDEIDAICKARGSVVSACTEGLLVHCLEAYVCLTVMMALRYLNQLAGHSTPMIDCH